jgi:putative ABC transport system substrate-binding protein
MRRREFIIVLGGAASWPVAGHAQPEQVRRVGVLIGFSGNDQFAQKMVSAFAQALERLGWVEGKNIRIDYRFAAGDPTLFKTYAAELVGLAPDVILGSTQPAVAALWQQTRTMPIVSYLCSIPSARALFEASRDPAATSRGSPPLTRRSRENGFNCSRRSLRASHGSP